MKRVLTLAILAACMAAAYGQKKCTNDGFINPIDLKDENGESLYNPSNIRNFGYYITTDGYPCSGVSSNGYVDIEGNTNYIHKENTRKLLKLGEKVTVRSVVDYYLINVENPWDRTKVIAQCLREDDDKEGTVRQVYTGGAFYDNVFVDYSKENFSNKNVILTSSKIYNKETKELDIPVESVVTLTVVGADKVEAVNCTKLKEITLKNVSTIPNNAFAECKDLTVWVHYDDPEKIAAVPKNAFPSGTKLSISDKNRKEFLAKLEEKGWKSENGFEPIEDWECKNAVGLAANASGEQICAYEIDADNKEGKSLKSLPEGYKFSAMTICDTEGNFVFENLRAGVYIFIVDKDGYDSQPSREIDLTGEGETIGGIDFVVDHENRTIRPTVAAATTFTVTFDSQGGSSVALQTIEEGGKVSQPAAATFTGHVFGGWYREAACLTAWNFDTDAVTCDITLYAKWTEASVTSAENLFALDLNVYPNPFTDAVRITSANGCTLQVINAAGVVVHTQTLANPDEIIRLEHLPAGVYFFRLETDGKEKTVKAVKQ